MIIIRCHQYTLSLPIISLMPFPLASVNVTGHCQYRSINNITLISLYVAGYQWGLHNNIVDASLFTPLAIYALTDCFIATDVCRVCHHLSISILILADVITLTILVTPILKVVTITASFRLLSCQYLPPIWFVIGLKSLSLSCCFGLAASKYARRGWWIPSH